MISREELDTLVREAATGSPTEPRLADRVRIREDAEA